MYTATWHRKKNIWTGFLFENKQSDAKSEADFAEESAAQMICENQAFLQILGSAFFRDFLESRLSGR